MRICTIVARNYLPYARVLTESFLAQDPGGESIVLVIDDRNEEIDESSEPFRTLRPDALSIERFEAMAAMYDVTELSTAVKPWLLEHLLADDSAGPIAYFDPDIRFYASVEQIERLAAKHELVLIPHITAPIPDDGRQPGEIDLMASGVYNLGFVAMAPSERVRELLHWWQKRLRYDCVIDHALGYFVDQRWFDLVPNTFAGTVVMRDPGMNVAYWNLHERQISRAKDGRWFVNGEALHFYHFSGFDPANPHLLSKHQTRTRLSEHPAVAELCAAFAAEVDDHRRPGERDIGYAWDQLADGRKLDRRLRRLYREGERAGAFELSPFEPDGALEFAEWLREPMLGHGEDSVSRFWLEVYRERPDLQTAFPDLGAQIEPFNRWIAESGHEVGDIKGLAPREKKRDTATPSRADIVTAPPARGAWGVNVAGFLQSELGIGEAARGLISALDAVRIPVLPVHGDWRPSSRQDHAYVMFDTDSAIFPINIVCVNADVLPQWMAQAGDEFRADRYTIGLWWWEVNAFPGAWLPAFDLVDEVWVATQHIADSLMPVASVPVTKVTMPVSPPHAPIRSRDDLGLPEDFLFMFVFDYHSVFERKNPLAIVEAFKLAFQAGSGASLLIKSINHEHHRAEHERLLLGTAEHPDIYVIDKYVSASEKNSMIASADCYVSLHRAEGFGLTMAEAMCLGKPVIATRYGGNLEFMNDRNSWLVDYDMVAIHPGCYPYPETGSWANPDVGQAAQHMQSVFENRTEVEERAARGQRDLHELHSPAVAGRQMQARLEHVRSRRSLWPRRTAADISVNVLNRPAELVAHGPQPPPRSPLGPVGRLLRRVVLRLIKPFTAYQQMVNSELLHAVEAMSEERAQMTSALEEHRLTEAGRTAAQLAELRRQFAWIEGLVRSASGLEIATVELQRATGELQQSSRELARTTVVVPELTQRLIDLTHRFDSVNRTVQGLEWGNQATPYMEGSPFTTRRHPVAGIVQGYSDAGEPSDHPYRSFENIFRGSEQLIRERQLPYLTILDVRQPVLDFGCGRGEFLDLLRDTGLSYLGVDLDAGMVARCREKGHTEVVHGDGLEFLQDLDDGSLGAIFAAQVIEHLSHEQLVRLLALARVKLRDDGVLIAETVNPHSAPALKTFWVDLTHVQPIFPEVALALCSEAGFASAYIFHPGASGNVERDRFTEGAYAVVASVTEPV